jgi:hypothetical protein
MFGENLIKECGNKKEIKEKHARRINKEPKKYCINKS